MFLKSFTVVADQYGVTLFHITSHEVISVAVTSEARYEEMSDDNILSQKYRDTAVSLGALASRAMLAYGAQKTRLVARI